MWQKIKRIITFLWLGACLYMGALVIVNFKNGNVENALLCGLMALCMFNVLEE